jgi:predicted secreted Zn-dependent protease
MRAVATLVWLIGAWLASAGAGHAELRTSTAIRYYPVSGTTLQGLARAMRANPISGDHGMAVANIRPYYDLRVTTRNVGGVCRGSAIRLSIDFTMTLPQASAAALSPGARSAWRSFVGYVRRHEEAHRGIYLQCARNFLARAGKLRSATGCFTVEAEARRLLAESNRACEARHLAFDRRERGRVARLALFRLTRSGR